MGWVVVWISYPWDATPSKILPPHPLPDPVCWFSFFRYIPPPKIKILTPRHPPKWPPPICHRPHNPVNPDHSLHFPDFVWRVHSLLTNSGEMHNDVIKLKHFRVTGPLWRESTGQWWIPLSKASDVELCSFLWSAPEQTGEQTLEMLVIWGAIGNIMAPW